MILPPNFIFSQSSLQDYLDCPRRFELRYLLKVRWPAPITEPVIEFEHHIQQGLQFHQMVQQYLNDLPLEKIQAAITDTELQAWWQNFISFAPTKPYEGKKFPEYRLSIPFEGFRLVAQYDLVIAGPEGIAVIFDWKTSRTHPRKGKMAARAQSLIYPFVLVEAGLPSLPVQARNVTMIYWYPIFPAHPDVINYDQKQHQENAVRIKDIFNRIINTADGEFGLTTDEHRCLFCNYRSLCSRGSKAGLLDQMEEDALDLSGIDSLDDLDFNNIPEIHF